MQAFMARNARLSRARLLVGAVALTGSLVGAQSAAAATGGAVGLKANVNAVGILPLDVGPLPAVTLIPGDSQPATASLVNTSVLGLITLQAASVSTQASGDPITVDSSATLAHADIAGLVSAKAVSSSCTATNTSSSGSATVVDLVVAGIPISTVDLGPNTTITLPVGTVTINEQSTSAATRSVRRTRHNSTTKRSHSRARARARNRARVRAGDAPSITVNAVHVKLNVLGLASGDVVLAQSRCGAS